MKPILHARHDRHLFSTEKKRFWAAALLVALLLAATWLAYPAVYDTNDDTEYIYYTAGYHTGQPYAGGAPFSNIIYGTLVSLLCRAAPALPWYTLLLAALMWLSFTCVAKTIFKATHKGAHPAFCGFAATILVYICAVYYYTVMLQFTFVSALCGTAACALFACAAHSGPAPQRWLDFTLFCILQFFAIIIRRESALLLLAFFFILLAKQLADALWAHKKNREHLIRLLAYAGAVVVLFAGCWLVQTVYVAQDPVWQHFYTIMPERQKRGDYPSASYNDAPELYAEIGWSEPLADVSKLAMNADRRQTLDSYKALNEYSKTTWEARPNASISNALFYTQVTLRDTLSEGTRQFWGYLGLGLAALAGVLACLSRKKWWDALWLLAFPAACAAITLYFCYLGRFPQRIASSIFLPAAALTAIWVLPVLGHIKASRMKVLTYTCLSLALLASFAFAFTTTGAAAEAQQRTAEAGEKRLMMDRYCMDRPGTMFLYDRTANFIAPAMHTYPSEKPVNCMSVGSIFMHSPGYYKALAANGMSTLHPDEYIAHNVEIITTSAPAVFKETMFRFMESDYAAKGFELTGTICDGVYVYRIF